MGIVQNFGGDAVERHNKSDGRGDRRDEGRFERGILPGEKVGGGDEKQNGVEGEGDSQKHRHVFGGTQGENFCGVGEGNQEQGDVRVVVRALIGAEHDGVGEPPVGAVQHAGKPSAVQNGDGFAVIGGEDEVSRKPENRRGGEQQSDCQGGADGKKRTGGGFHSADNYSGGGLVCERRRRGGFCASAAPKSSSA